MAVNDKAIGLAQNPAGIPFRCGSCEFYDERTCHNPLPKLKGREVKPEWCCNHYFHDRMSVIVA